MNTKAHGMAEKADEHQPAPHRRATVDRRSLPARFAALLALMLLLLAASTPAVSWAKAAAPASAPTPYALSVLAAAGLSGGPDAFGYTFDDSEGHPEHGLRFQNIAATGTVLAKGGADVAGLAGGNLDDGYYQVAVPFPFRFYGVDRNAASLYVSTNGFATFDAAGATTFLGSIPANAAPNDAFYPFWDDLKLDANAFGVDCSADIDCGLYVQTIGSAPNRSFIVQWNKVPFFDQDPDEGWVTFQAQLEEATGDIRFEYEPPAGCAATDCERASGGSASIGIESADPANLSGTPFTGLAYSQDEPALQAKANRYVANVVFHAPRLAVSKDCYALETDLHNPLAPTNRDTVTAGQQWICRVELASDNAGDVPNVQLQDSFGAGLTLVGVARTNIPNFTINPVAPLAGPDTVAIDLGTVPGRSRSYFELAFRVDPLDVVGTALGQGEVCNDATILSPAVGDANDHGGDCDLVIDRADLSIDKVLPSAHVAAGAPFVYTVIVDNHGPSASRGVRILDDVIAAGAVSVAGGSAAITSDRAMADLNGGAAGLCSVSATQIECALADSLEPAGETAPPGAQPGRWMLRIPLIATDSAAIQNRVCVGTGALVRPPAGPAGDWRAGTIDPNTADNCDSEAAVVEAVADLAITKADDVALFTLAGSSFDYTVTVTNNGPSIATGVVAIDTLPLGVRLRDPNGALPPPPITVVGGGTCTSVQGVAQNVIVQCNLGDMAAATARTIVLRVTTDPALPAQVLMNRAEVQSRGGQPTPPSLLSRLLGAQRGQDADQQLGLPAFDPNQANNVARDDTNIGAFATLRINKDGSPDPVAAGGVADYRIDVVNTGPSLARNVRLDDVFADIGGLNAGAYLTLAKADVFGGGGEARCYQEDFGGATSVGCTLGDIAAGQAVRVDLKVAVAPNTPPGPAVLRNAVALAADSPVALDPLSDVTAQIDVVGTSQLSVTKVASEPSPLAGGSFSYALTVTNNGPSNAYGVVLVDGLPAGVTFVAVDDARCVGLVNVVACSLGQMTAQQSIRVVVTVDLAAGFGCGAPIVNAALAQWFAAPNSNTPQQAAGISMVRSRCEADLIVTKLSKPDGDQIAGQPIEYTVIVDNRGPSVAPSAAVKDLLQSDGTFDILSVDSDRPATCNSLPVAGGGPFPAPPAAGAVAGVDRRYQLDCTLAVPLGVLAADGPPNTGRWILTVRAVAGTAQSLNNVATGVAAVRDPDVSNNQDRTANRVTNGADLRVVKFGKPDGSVQAGGILTYTLLVDNLGPNTATGVALKDVLRSNGTFDVIDVTSDRPMACGSSPNGLAATGTPANPAAPGNAGGLDIDCRLTAPLPPLGVGAGPGFSFPNEGRWTLSMRVRAAQAQTINNVADVLGALEDADLSNNHAIVEHDVTDVADLSLAKSGPLTVVAGATMAYSITVANAGPSDAANVVVLDRLPNGITVTDAQVTGGGSCTTGTPGSAADRLTCHLGAMPAPAAGTPKTVLITVAVDPDVPAGTILENDAFVLSDVFDANNANNADFALTSVTASADLGIVKTDAPDPVTAGQALSYNLLVTNAGPSTARDVTVTDALPAGTAFVNAGAAGGSCAYAAGPHTLQCSLGDLVAGGSFAITVNVTVDGDVPNGATMTNTATATSPTSDPVGANNASTAVTTVAARADLSIDKAASGSGVSGSEILYTITVTNHGPSTAQAVQVIEALPPGVTYVWDDDSCAAGGSPCSLGNLAAGALVTFHVAVRVNADAIGVLENGAAVTSPTPDGTPANNTDIADVTAVPTADLQIMKYSVPAIVTTGEPMVFTLLVQNLGPGLARNATIDDTFIADAGYTITAIGGATCTPSAGAYSGNSVRTCQLGDMPPFTQRLVTFTVTTTDSTKLTNVAAVQSDAADPNHGNDKADVSNDVRQSADVSVDKSSVAVPGPSVVAGQQVRYTMVVRNSGPSRATGVQLWDRLPAGIVVTGYTAVGPSGGPPIGCTTGTAGSAADLFTCNVGALDVGQTATVVATATVNANLPDGSVVENDALVTADTFDRNPGDNRDTVLDTVATSADLSITKSDSPDPVVAGEPLEYTLTVHNAGPSGAKDVLVSDQLPAGVTFTGATIVGGDGTCSDSPTGLVTCFLGHLDVDQTVRIYLDVVVKATTAAGTLSNGASVTSSTADPSNVDNGAGATTTVRTLADLSITKRILGVPVAGQPVTYEVVVSNGGPSAATGVEVIDSYSANQSYSWDTGNCSVSGVNEVTCALGALAVGGSRTFQVTFDVAANAAFQDATNGVTVTSDQADPNPADNAATTRTPIDGLSDLRITKFGKPDAQVRQSGLLTYTVLVENLGPSDAGGVVVRDTVASDGNFEVVSVLGAACTPGVGTYLGGVAMDCALPNPLPAFGQASFRMVLRPIEARSINNSASVRSANRDPDASNNVARVEHDVTELADLSVTKTAAPNPAVAGGSIVWTMRVVNNGPGIAENAVLMDRLPSGVVVTGFTASLPAGATGGCTTGTAGSAIDQLLCNLGTLKDGESATVTLTADVSPSLPDGHILENDVLVGSGVLDALNANNRATTLTPVSATANLSINKSASPSPATAGQPLQYTLTVGNGGPSTAKSAVVVDTLPAGVAFVRAVVIGAPGASCADVPAGAVTCQLGDLPPGQLVTIYLNTIVNPGFAGSLSNTALVRSQTADPAPANNVATAVTPVSAAADLSITKLANRLIVVPGRNFRYTITARNNGPSDAAGVQVLDTLPAGVAFVADQDGCTAAGQNVTCNLGTLLVGQTVQFDVEVAVAPSVADNLTLTNNARVTATTADPTASNNAAIAKVVTNRVADLSVRKFGKPDGGVRTGEDLIYTILVDNFGPSDAGGVVVQDILKADGGFEFRSALGATCAPAPIQAANQSLTLSCTIGLVPTGTTAQVTIVVRATTSKSVNNVATARSADADDPNTGNNTGYVEHDITLLADMAVTKAATGEVTNAGPANCGLATTATANAVTAGRNLTYVLTVTNNGPNTTENVLVRDRLPLGFAVTSIAVTGGGACNAGTAGSAGDVLTCGLDGMTVGQVKTITVQGKTDPNLSGGLILGNDVNVTSSLLDANNQNNYAHNLTTVSTAADLAITKTAEPPAVVAGQTIVQYTIMVVNNGPSLAQTVSVADTLPAGLSFQSASGAVCRQNPASPQQIGCQVGDLPAGGMATIFVVGKVNADTAPGVLANIASTTSKTPDPCAANNTSAPANVTVSRVADVFITKTALADPAIAGGLIRWRVQFGNIGPSTATAVRVEDLLPPGVVFQRCESIDPNDAVSCTVVSGDGLNVRQTIRLASVNLKNSALFTDLGEIKAGDTLTFDLVGRIAAGYVLDQRGDGHPGEMCAAYGQAAGGYTAFAHNRATITSAQDSGLVKNNFDDVCTRVNGLADLSIDKTVESCSIVLGSDPVTYVVTVTNDGPSDAAKVVVKDVLPEQLDAGTVTVEAGGGMLVSVNPVSREVTVMAGNSNGQIGRVNAGTSAVVRITGRWKPSDIDFEASDTASVTTIKDGVTWPGFLAAGGAPSPDAIDRALADDPLAPGSRTPTRDPEPVNNTKTFKHGVLADPVLVVNKTVSLTGQCPGVDVPVMVGPGQPVTYCIELKNRTSLRIEPGALVTDTVHSKLGDRLVFAERIETAIEPGQSIVLKATDRFRADECGADVNNVVATAILRTGAGDACLRPVTGKDRHAIMVPCTDGATGADARIGLPIINGPADAVCTTWIQIQNLGCANTKAMVVFWGDRSACPPQSAGPLKIECTGLLRSGSAWSVMAEGNQIPAGARSAIVYSVNADDLIKTPRGNDLPFADAACGFLFQAIVGDYLAWTEFDHAYQTFGVFRWVFNNENLSPLELDFGKHQGQPLGVTVNQGCPDPTDPNTTNNGGYTGIPTAGTGVYDPQFGGYTYYTPLVFANKASLNSLIAIQNLGLECTSLEIYLKDPDNCMRPILGDVLALSPGERLSFDPNVVAGPDWIGSAWIRATQPLAVAVATQGANHLTIYNGVPGDVYSVGFTLGSQVNYAPLTYSEYQGWDSAITVQNLSATYAAKVKVYFLDRGGDIITTLVDWVCPRGSQSYFLPVIASLPGNWVGSARVESQEWVTPGAPVNDPPRVQSVMMLERWIDPARTSRREAIAYNLLTEQVAFDWQLGILNGGTTSGSAVIAVPLVAKGNRGVTSEIGITNLVPKPGFTDFAIYLYDQNGLLDHYCQKLNEKQVEYIDLNTQGFLSGSFLGSAVISATFWEHDVFDGHGQFQRNLVGLGAVVIERVGSTQGAADVPGDESKGYEGIPVGKPYCERSVLCPGVPEGARP